MRLLHYDEDAERTLAATLLFRAGHLSYEERAVLAARLAPAQVAEVLRAGFAGLDAHDTVLREFETVTYTFELVVSEACLHQLVRHRMSTQVVQSRDGSLGYAVPPLIAAAGDAPLARYHLGDGPSR